jgi:hypothetical protein
MDWLEDRSFISDWCLRESWTPLQAACLLREARPSATDGDLTGIAVELDPDLVNRPDEAAEFERDLKQSIEVLHATVEANHPDLKTVVPAEIVQWAVNNDIVPQRSLIARRLGIRKDDTSKRGKHWKDDRIHILGAALRALAKDRDGLVKGSGEIHREFLADAVDEQRVEYGLPTEGRPTFDTIRRAIAEALKSSTKEKSED